MYTNQQRKQLCLTTTNISIYIQNTGLCLSSIKVKVNNSLPEEQTRKRIKSTRRSEEHRPMSHPVYPIFISCVTGSIQTRGFPLTSSFLNNIPTTFDAKLQSQFTNAAPNQSSPKPKRRSTAIRTLNTGRREGRISPWTGVGTVRLRRYLTKAPDGPPWRRGSCGARTRTA